LRKQTIGVEEGAGVVVTCVGLPYHHKPLRMPVGQRPQDHSFDNAEDGSVRTDAEREGQHNHQRITRRLLVTI
jgi:hypothetical protein